MKPETIPQAEWPTLERLVVLAAKITGKLSHAREDDETLTIQTAQLYGRICRLIPPAELKKIMSRASENLQEIASVSVIERQIALMALIGQAAFGYVQPYMFEAVMTALMTVVQSSITWQGQQGLANMQELEPAALTTRDKSLLFVLALMGAQLGRPLQALHPSSVANLKRVRDFFASEVRDAPLGQEDQAELTQTLTLFIEGEHGGGAHWPNMVSSALAATMWAYKSDRPSPLPDQALLKLVQARLDLAEAHRGN